MLNFDTILVAFIWINTISFSLKDKYDKLAEDKRHLERLLEAEVMNAYHLSRENSQLRIANRKLKIEADHLILDKAY